MAWNVIAKASDFESRSMKIVMMGDNPVIVSKIDGKFYAVDAICTHMQGYLPAGKMEGSVITCPVHRAQFDLKTGKMTKDVPGLMKAAIGGAKDLKSYELRVEGDEIKANV